MKHRLTILAVTIILLGAAITSSHAASTNKTGTCLNGASWSLTAKRSGTSVTTILTVKPLPPKSMWNVNYAMIPINKVRNVAATATSQGVLTLKNTASSSEPLTTYIIIDTWAPVSIMSCAVGVTL